MAVIHLSVTSKSYLLLSPVATVADMFLFIRDPVLDFEHYVLFGGIKKRMKPLKEMKKNTNPAGYRVIIS